MARTTLFNKQSQKRLNLAKSLATAMVFLSVLGGVEVVHAQAALVGEDYRRVEALISAKNNAAAAQLADSYLANNPRDPQMRLLKSRVLVAQNKHDEARALLLSLTQEYPEIAEPYNNLAVLYAQEGQLDLARAALENALRIHPRYATALQNLGDVYRRMSYNSYKEALLLQPNNVQPQEKIRQP